MKKTVMLVVVLLLGAGGFYYLAYGQPADLPQITQAVVTDGDVIAQIQATGVLEPLRTTLVGSQVSGMVAALYADFNSIVRKDQILAELDRSLLETQVDLQNATYERQLGEIANQEGQLEDATKQLERTQALFERALVTQQQLDQAVLTVKTRMSALESARKQVLTAKANLDQANLNLSYTTIRSPVDGVVISREVDVGQTVQSSANVAQFFTLATDLRRLKLTAHVDEAEIGSVRPGMSVTFTVDGYPGERFGGRVNSVHLNASASSNVVTYPVLIDTENPELKLRPGMTATVRILISTSTNVLRVPNQALRFRPTADMYAALGVTPPTGPQGRGLAGAPAPQAAPGQGSRPAAPPIADEDTGKIDDLFESPPARLTQGRVWIWDELARTLSEVRVTTGASDGIQSQLVSGDLTAGQRVVTGIVLPQTSAQRNTANSAIFGGRGPSGPGGFPGGAPGGFAGGPPGGFGRGGGGD
jgi:HlyD family secretion protein